MADSDTEYTEYETKDIKVDIDELQNERSFISLLIDLYRSHPVLWKVKHEHYSDKTQRKMALDEMVNELRVYKPDYTEEMLKKKINIIRTNFNKEKNKKRNSIKAGKKPKTNLWYYNELLFLNDAYEGASIPKRRASIYIANKEPTQEQDEVEEEHEHFETEHLELELEPKYESEVEIEPESVRKRKRVSIKPTRRPFKKITVEKQVIEPDENNDSDLEQYMTVTTTYYKKKKTKEEIMAMNWALKLKKMAPEQRMFAEKIINDVVFEGQLGNLTKNGVSFCPAFP